MENIQEILKKKSSKRNGGRRELDEKTVARVFLEAAKDEIKNLLDTDIREMKLKDKTLYIKTAHPIVSSELLMRREKLINKINQIAGDVVIEKIFI